MRAPSQWFRYVDDTCIKIKPNGSVTEHELSGQQRPVNVGGHITGNSEAVLDYAVYTEEDRSHNIEIQETH